MRVIRIMILGVCVAVLALAGRGLGPVSSLHAAADGKGANAAVRDGQPISPEEWVEILKWMQQYRPAQFRVLNAMPEGPQKNRAKQLVAEKYRSIKRLNNPRMRDAAIAETKAQDEVFAAEISLRDAKHTGSAAQIVAAKVQLQTAVEHLFEAQIAHKSARINQLQSEIDVIQKDIDRLQKRKPEFVTKWTNKLMNGRPIQDASPSQAESPGNKPSNDDSK